MPLCPAQARQKCRESATRAGRGADDRRHGERASQASYSSEIPVLYPKGPGLTRQRGMPGPGASVAGQRDGRAPSRAASATPNFLAKGSFVR